MFIAGMQKMTLLDYPGKVACTIFLQGCNFRCPFCHNSELLDTTGEGLLETEQVLSFLKSRRGLLDAVCVSGGEPTLCPELPAFLRAIKAMGYQVKLDTNGTRPKVLKALVEEGLLDYVAMDIKNSPERYGETAGVPRMTLQNVEESMVFLLGNPVDYEFRTTVVQELHDEASIVSMGAWVSRLAGGGRAKRFFLQKFVDRESVLLGSLSAPTEAALERYAALLRTASDCVGTR